ncbi:unnamed protein product, partial [Polarella glacialis]
MAVHAMQFSGSSMRGPSGNMAGAVPFSPQPVQTVTYASGSFSQASPEVANSGYALGMSPLSRTLPAYEGQTAGEDFADAGTLERSEATRVLEELRQTREERDAARRELAEVRLELERLQQQVGITANVPLSTSGPGPLASPKVFGTAPSMPSSWQPVLTSEDASRTRSKPSPATVSFDHLDESDPLSPGAASNGVERSPVPVATAPAMPSAAWIAPCNSRDRRQTEVPVEVIVSAPRAWEEISEERERRTVPPARSVQSLSAQSMQAVWPVQTPHMVMRLPSAPMHMVSAYASPGGHLSYQAPATTGNLQFPSRAMGFPWTPSNAVPPSAPASL